MKASSFTRGLNKEINFIPLHRGKIMVGILHKKFLYNKNYTKGSNSNYILDAEDNFILIKTLTFLRVCCHTSLPNLFQTGQREEEVLTGTKLSKFN